MKITAIYQTKRSFAIYRLSADMKIHRYSEYKNVSISSCKRFTKIVHSMTNRGRAAVIVDVLNSHMALFPYIN
jgi:hypothetical protein